MFLLGIQDYHINKMRILYFDAIYDSYESSRSPESKFSKLVGREKLEQLKQHEVCLYVCMYEQYLKYVCVYACVYVCHTLLISMYVCMYVCMYASLYSNTACMHLCMYATVS
jgi:hypothetical protein